MKKPAKKHIELYAKFRSQLHHVLSESKRIKPKDGEEPPTVFEPRARGTRRKLVPPPRKYPCDFCAHAQYNKLCSESMRCGPFIYYQFSILERLPS